MPDGYGDDLAYIHDVGHGFFAQQSAPGLLGLLRQSGVDRGLVVDLGCGSGQWARVLVDAGYDVLGVDQSAAMTALARKKVPEAAFCTESFLRTALPRCDAVTSIGECINYLFDRKNSPKELARLFDRVYQALRPGGVFLFDVLEPGQVRGPAPRLRHRTGDDWAVLVRVEEDAEQRTLTRHITSFRRVGRLYRRGEETHRQRLVPRAEIVAALRQAGFGVRVLCGYGAHRFAGRHAAYRARKPSPER